MDKRTLLFLIAVSISFFLVNMYFEQPNQEALKKWQDQQIVKKTQMISDLESELAKKTAAPSSLPLMELFSDASATASEAVGIAVLDRTLLLTLSWDGTPPQKLFARPLGSTAKAEEYYILSAPQKVGGPLLYHHGAFGKLWVADLPDFGRFDLQVVALHPGNKTKPYSITLADYSDGHFLLLQEKINKLKSELKIELPESPQEQGGAIALMKTDSGYLPVAIYDYATRAPIYLEEYEELAPLIEVKIAQKQQVATTAEEKYYVLENSYQQLVFSNIGGALAEINLPFASDTNKVSVVREIEFDREMVEYHPYNARFPSHPYYTPAAKSGEIHEDHIEGKLGGYYPLIRRDLIESRGRKSTHIPPRFYALNIVSEYPEVAELVYTVKEFTQEKIVFEANQGHRKITKTFSLAPEEQGAPYCINLKIEIEGDSRGLWLTTGIPEVEIISGSPAPALKYRITRKQAGSVETIDLPGDASTNSQIYPDWVCNSNGFLGMILNPTTEIDPGYRAQFVQGSSAPSRLVEIDQEYGRFKAQEMPGYMLLMPLKKNGGTMEFHVYAGPFADETLKAVDAFYSDPTTGYNPDFIASQTFHGWFSFISEPFAKFLFLLMRFFHFITGSWAFSIILLTVALRVMLYPLNAWSTKSMLKMQQISPEVTALQEKHKKDPKKLQMEIVNLYRERGVNPMSGCLPLLIQMPFLIGMFDLLKSTFELRGASFIPGWIDDLAAPDVLFSWGKPLFFIGNQFHLLPFFLGGVMFLQQRMSATLPKDPNLWTEQQRQQRTMGTMMTVVFTVMFYNFPSGLNIYWLSSMLLGIAQQWWTQKTMQVKKK